MADRDTSVVNIGPPIDRRGNREFALGCRPLRSGKRRFVEEKRDPSDRDEADVTGAGPETLSFCVLVCRCFLILSERLNELLSVPPRCDNIYRD